MERIRGQAGEEVRGSGEELRGLERAEDDCVEVQHAGGQEEAGKARNHSEGQGKRCLAILNT